MTDRSATRRYSRYKYRAKKKGIPFTLTLREFALITALPCYFCSSRELPTGVDRMDNSGYHVHTTCQCCTRCNALKQDMSMAEFDRLYPLTTGGERGKIYGR